MTNIDALKAAFAGVLTSAARLEELRDRLDAPAPDGQAFDLDELRKAVAGHAVGVQALRSLLEQAGSEHAAPPDPAA